MFFGRKRKTNHKVRIRIKFEEVDLIALSSGGVYLELNTKTRILKYRNVISPRDGGMHFPEGYFDEGTATITQNSMNDIAYIFNKLFQKRYPENDLDFLLRVFLIKRMFLPMTEAVKSSGLSQTDRETNFVQERRCCR